MRIIRLAGGSTPLPLTRSMQPFETIPIDSMIAACNGGGGPLGHPKVYLNLSADGKVECPYCSRLFVYRGHAADGHGAEMPSATGAREERGSEHPAPAAPNPRAATHGAPANPASPAKP
jgi:uncharacterized Zn-finger protein